MDKRCKVGAPGSGEGRDAAIATATIPPSASMRYFDMINGILVKDDYPYMMQDTFS
jgi:hypothetical protein